MESVGRDLIIAIVDIFIVRFNSITLSPVLSSCPKQVWDYLKQVLVFFCALANKSARPEYYDVNTAETLHRTLS